MPVPGDLPGLPRGIVLAHSNESEWEQFKNNKNNEAFLDRICVVKVCCLRVAEEAMIYAKLLEEANCARLHARRKCSDSCALLHPHSPQGASEFAAFFETARLQQQEA